VLGGMVASSAFGRQAPAAMEHVELGKTGARVSRLGIGCGQLWRPEVSDEQVAGIIHRAVELGVNYFDVAPNYGNDDDGYAETRMGPVIQEIRPQLFLVSKTDEPDYEGTWQKLRQSLSRLKTDYLDLVHLHNIGHEPRFPDLDFTLGENGALGALLEAREQGIIRFIGASGHLHPSRFHRVLDTGKIDVLMNAVNFIARHTYDFEHKVWSRVAEQGGGLVAMKVLGGRGDDGFRVPAEYYERAIRYALSVRGVHVAVIGVKTVVEVEQAAQTVAGATPLSEDEAHELSVAGLSLSRTGRWPTAYGRPVT
jgi:uncharacterized protein